MTASISRHLCCSAFPAAGSFALSESILNKSPLVLKEGRLGSREVEADDLLPEGGCDESLGGGVFLPPASEDFGSEESSGEVRGPQSGGGESCSGSIRRWVGRCFGFGDERALVLLEDHFSPHSIRRDVRVGRLFSETSSFRGRMVLGGYHVVSDSILFPPTVVADEDAPEAEEEGEVEDE